MIDEQTVRHVARLARLHLEPDEVVTMQAELSGILGHIEVIQSLELDDVPPTTHVEELVNVLREDEPRPSLPREEALREAPEAVDGGFAVGRF